MSGALQAGFRTEMARLGGQEDQHLRLCFHISCEVRVTRACSAWKAMGGWEKAGNGAKTETVAD